MMGRGHRPSTAVRWALAGAALGAAFFLALYGVRVLDPTQVDWMLNAGADPAQHYLGWAFYRQSEVRLPYLGMSYATIYPHRISVVYTDSLPLFALVFKLLDPLLPADFQYFGWWGLLCYALQGYFAQRLIARLGGARGCAGNLAALAAAGAVVLFPALRIRMFAHTALAGTWLILAALWLWADAPRKAATLPRAAAWWGLMGVLGAGLHLYYLPMMGMVLVGYALWALWTKRGPALALAPVGAYCACALAELFVLGAFAGNYSGTSAGWLSGADLAGLFLPAFNTKYETNVYLGAGGVLLCVLGAAGALVWAVRAGRAGLRRAAPWAVSAAVIGLLSAMASASNQITLAGHALLTVPLPGFVLDLWSMFSSCARLAWLLGLLLMALGAAAVLRAARPGAALALLALCLAVQAGGQWDSLAASAESYRSPERYASASCLEDPGWQTVAQSGSIRHLAFVSLDTGSDVFWGCAQLAARNDWTVNSFYLAHMDAHAAAYSIPAQLDQPQPATLYVFSSTGDELRRGGCPLNYYRLDGVLVGTLETLDLPPAEPDTAIVQVDLDALNFEAGSASTHNADGSLTLAGGESVSGGQWMLMPGSYLCTIRGDGLDHCYVRSGYHLQKEPYQALDIAFIEGGASLVSFRFDLQQPAPGWEFAVHTLDERALTLTQVSLQKLG